MREYLLGWTGDIVFMGAIFGLYFTRHSNWGWPFAILGGTLGALRLWARVRRTSN